MRSEKRELFFEASALEDLKALPTAVQKVLGTALLMVQYGETPDIARPLFEIGNGVYELRHNFNTDTYRAVYVVRFEDAVYVLHCFQKKSKSGISLPRPDKEVIEKRLKVLEARQRAKAQSLKRGR